MDKLGIVREKKLPTTAFEGAIGSSDDEDDSDYAEGDEKADEGMEESGADVKIEDVHMDEDVKLEDEGVKIESEDVKIEEVDVKREVETDFKMEGVDVNTEEIDEKMAIEEVVEETSIIEETPVENTTDQIKQEETETQPTYSIKQTTYSSDESDLEVLAAPVKKIKTPKPTKKEMFARLKRIADEQADRERAKREVIIQAKRDEIAERERERYEKLVEKTEREAVVEETRRVARELKVQEKLAAKEAKAALAAEKFVTFVSNMSVHRAKISCLQKCTSQSEALEKNPSLIHHFNPIPCSSHPAVSGQLLYHPRHRQRCSFPAVSSVTSISMIYVLRKLSMWLNPWKWMSI
jgi:hypothetical protein